MRPEAEAEWTNARRLANQPSVRLALQRAVERVSGPRSCPCEGCPLSPDGKRGVAGDEAACRADGPDSPIVMVQRPGEVCSRKELYLHKVCEGST